MVGNTIKKGNQRCIAVSSKILKNISLLLLVATAVVFFACSTKENTAKSRWWHSFNAKYNTYYNGAQAYIEGSLEKENGNRDNYTERLPLYPVGNKNSREIGKANFDRAIEKAEKAIARHSIKRRPEWNKNRKKTEKDIEWLSRKEYNPFLWKAWMLMGRSQFHKGAFDEAVATFAYMGRLYKGQAAIRDKANAWLAKSYVEAGWLYEAEDLIRNMRRDSIDWRAMKDWDHTLTDYYLHTGDLEKASNYLRRVIRQEMRRKQKARQWYLMGQIQTALGNKQAAYNAFQRVSGLNPPYELAFNAQIAATEVMSGGQSKKMVARLKRMAASDKNKEYLDQVYYAIGNIYLSDKDTVSAISSYEEGNKKSTRNGIEKGVLLLKLGELYWDKECFGDARRCYNEALGLLDKDRKDYEQLSYRSKILDELAPNTDAIHLQDSLQYLAKCPEKERLAAIDRVIAEVKKREKEERNREAEAAAAKQQADNGGQEFDMLGNARQKQIGGSTQDATWYFYNPMAVQQGKSSFQRLWGKRENVDDWNRINKTVVGDMANNQLETLTEAQRDSIEREEIKRDSLKNIADSAQNNPHKREYYLAQIPFTPEQVDASNKIIAASLHKAGVIFKDRLDNLRLSEKALRRLTDQYPSYEQIDDVFYHLYLLYMRKNETQKAESYIARLKANHPQSQWTALLTDPYFKENAKFGEQIEDSLYAATYDAFKQNRFNEVDANARISDTRFSMGANRDKFLFISGLSKLNENNVSACINRMNTVVEQFPKSRISEMAGMIINGVKAGKKIRNGKFDLGEVWNQRTDVMNDSDSIKQAAFTADRDIDFRFILVYHPDSLSENKLLFEMARFNFTNFIVRNFDISIDDLEGLHRMQISGFRSYEEVYQYARQLFASKNVAQQISKDAKAIIISEKNLELIGTAFSYKDYEAFYEKHFATIKVTHDYLLSEPAKITQPRERDLLKEIEERNPDAMNLDLEDAEKNPIEGGMNIPIEGEPATSSQPVAPEIIVPTEQPASQQPTTTKTTVEVPVQPQKKEPIAKEDDRGMDIPLEDDSTDNNGGFEIPFDAPKTESKTPVKVDKSQTDGKTTQPVQQKKMETKSKTSTTDKKMPATPAVKPTQPITNKTAGKTATTKKTNTDGTVIYFEDDAKTATTKKKDKKPVVLDDDFDDEYYDLEGF